MELLLASGSPRRAELLRSIGAPFTLLTPPDIDETPRPVEAPAAYVERMAREKARAGAAGLQTLAGRAVLGADTSVVHGQHILGKPRHREDALAMLARLSGSEHQVLSAVSLVTAAGQATLLSSTRVRFRSLSEAERLAYVDTGEPMDKAGGYGIQGFAAVFVEWIHGSYSGVVGLPLTETRTLLAQAGVSYWHRTGTGSD